MLDANVLVPISLTDTLLCLADNDLYEPMWSQIGRMSRPAATREVLLTRLMQYAPQFVAALGGIN